MGDLRNSMSNKRRRELNGTGRGSVGRAIVAGVKDRETKQVHTEVVDNTDSGTLQSLVVRDVWGIAPIPIASNPSGRCSSEDKRASITR